MREPEEATNKELARQFVKDQEWLVHVLLQNVIHTDRGEQMILSRVARIRLFEIAARLEPWLEQCTGEEEAEEQPQ